jgi:adenylate kinase
VRLIILGPQGAGKGTQAAVVAAKFAIPHVSTGDIFRANIAAATPLGVQAKSYIEAGDLVPDEVTNSMIRGRLQEPDARSGFLLDGFPRNAAQSWMLDEFLASRGEHLDVVIELHIDESHLLERLAHRAEQEGRSDDTEEAIRRRLDIYYESTAPLVDFYRQKGLLRTVDGVGSVDDVTARILNLLPS